MTDTHIITHSLLVKPRSESINSERCTVVRLDDEGAGAFIVLDQSGHSAHLGKIAIDPDEWETLCQAIETMLHQAKALDAKASGVANSEQRGALTGMYLDPVRFHYNTDQPKAD